MDFNLPGIGNLGGNLIEAGKERLRMETMAKTLGYNLPKDIHFSVEDGPKENGKDTKNLVAKLTDEQAKNLQETIGKLNPDEQKALLGNMQFTIDTKDGKSSLVLHKADSHTLGDINDFNREKNGSAAGFTAALAGDLDAVKKAVDPLVPQKPAQNNGPQAPDQSTPLGGAKSSKADDATPEHVAAAPLDLSKLAAAGLKIPESAPDKSSGHGLEGVVAKTQEVATGRSA